MKKYAVICTKSKPDLDQNKMNLESYLYSAGIKTMWMIAKESIFQGYQEGLETQGLAPDDILIFCHDDITPLLREDLFNYYIDKNLRNDRVGFVGVAGTSQFDESGVWWNGLNTPTQRQILRGTVFHGRTLQTMMPTFFGPYGKAVVMDGVFLAAKVKNLHKIGLHKPSNFTGNWDFYDVVYTLRAHKKGFTNIVAPIPILHQSPGNGIHGDGWKENRKALVEHFRGKFPFICT